MHTKTPDAVKAERTTTLASGIIGYMFREHCNVIRADRQEPPPAKFKPTPAMKKLHKAVRTHKAALDRAKQRLRNLGVDISLSGKLQPRTPNHAQIRARVAARVEQRLMQARTLRLHYLVALALVGASPEATKQLVRKFAIDLMKV